MSTLNQKFSEDLVVTKKRLQETKELVNKEIAGIFSCMNQENVNKRLGNPFITNNLQCINCENNHNYSHRRMGRGGQLPPSFEKN